MQTIQNFSEMVRHLSASGQKITIAVACGDDDSTLQAVTRALASGFARAIFVGDASVPRAYAPMQDYAELVEFVEPETAEPAAAAALAVRLVREGRAGILMKGLISTDVLLRAVLNKAEGLLPPGKVLTHLAVAQIPERDRLLFFTDAAVIPYPTQFQREAQVGELAGLLHRLGVTEPRIALNHCAETVSEKFPHTVGYAAIIRQAAEGRWGRLRVDGPLDLRTSLDPQCLATKGIVSVLEGRADALVLPDIETGNLLYKALPLFAAAKVAGVLCGTLKPVVLPSRGDDAEAKYHSLLLAVFNA